MMAATLLLALAAADAGTEGTKPLVQGKIAVLDLSAVNAPPELAATLTETIITEAASVPGVQVIGKSDIKAMLTFEMQKALLGCSDDKCLIDVGGALGADILLTGSLSKVGTVWLVNLKVLDTKAAQSLGRREQQVEGGEAQLLAVARNLTSLLLTGREKVTTGFLELWATLTGAEVVVDGHVAGQTPLAQAIPLDVGEHKVTVRKDGYIPWESAVTIEPARTQKLQVSLIEVALVAGRKLMPYVWASLGLGLAAAGGGTYFGLDARQNFDAYRGSTSKLAAADLQKQTQDSATIANWLFIGAGVAGVLASTLFIVDTVMMAPASGGGGGIMVGGEW